MWLHRIQANEYASCTTSTPGVEALAAVSGKSVMTAPDALRTGARFGSFLHQRTPADAPLPQGFPSLGPVLDLWWDDRDLEPVGALPSKIALLPAHMPGAKAPCPARFSDPFPGPFPAVSGAAAPGRPRRVLGRDHGV